MMGLSRANFPSCLGWSLGKGCGQSNAAGKKSSYRPHIQQEVPYRKKSHTFPPICTIMNFSRSSSPSCVSGSPGGWCGQSNAAGEGIPYIPHIPRETPYIRRSHTFSAIQTLINPSRLSSNLCSRGSIQRWCVHSNAAGRTVSNLLRIQQVTHDRKKSHALAAVQTTLPLGSRSGFPPCITRSLERWYGHSNAAGNTNSSLLHVREATVRGGTTADKKGAGVCIGVAAFSSSRAEAAGSAAAARTGIAAVSSSGPEAAGAAPGAPIGIAAFSRSRTEAAGADAAAAARIGIAAFSSSENEAAGAAAAAARVGSAAFSTRRTETAEAAAAARIGIAAFSSSAKEEAGAATAAAAARSDIAAFSSGEKEAAGAAAAAHIDVAALSSGEKEAAGTAAGAPIGVAAISSSRTQAAAATAAAHAPRISGKFSFSTDLSKCQLCKSAKTTAAGAAAAAREWRESRNSLSGTFPLNSPACKPPTIAAAAAASAACEPRKSKNFSFKADLLSCRVWDTPVVAASGAAAAAPACEPRRSRAFSINADQSNRQVCRTPTSAAAGAAAAAAVREWGRSKYSSFGTDLSNNPVCNIPQGVARSIVCVSGFVSQCIIHKRREDEKLLLAKAAAAASTAACISNFVPQCKIYRSGDSFSYTRLCSRSLSSTLIDKKKSSEDPGSSSTSHTSESRSASSNPPTQEKSEGFAAAGAASAAAGSSSLQQQQQRQKEGEIEQQEGTGKGRENAAFASKQKEYVTHQDKIRREEEEQFILFQQPPTQIFRLLAILSALGVCISLILLYESSLVDSAALLYGAWDPEWDASWREAAEKHEAELAAKGNQLISSSAAPAQAAAAAAAAAAGQQQQQQLLLPATLRQPTRQILLVRHGQYHMGATDEERGLTELGRRQAAATGRRLQELLQGQHVIAIVCSNMKRARETAEIIQESGGFKGVPLVEDAWLAEGAPAEPVPPSDSFWPSITDIAVDGPRIEQAFRRYFYRAKSHRPPSSSSASIERDGSSLGSQGASDAASASARRAAAAETSDPGNVRLAASSDAFIVLVCHGNVIRYFLMRALQLPACAWLRWALVNAGLTWISIDVKGRVSCRSFGDAGHLSTHLISYN